jgi:hypothetical protein
MSCGVISKNESVSASRKPYSIHMPGISYKGNQSRRVTLVEPSIQDIADHMKGGYKRVDASKSFCPPLDSCAKQQINEARDCFGMTIGDVVNRSVDDSIPPCAKPPIETFNKLVERQSMGYLSG